MGKALSSSKIVLFVIIVNTLLTSYLTFLSVHSSIKTMTTKAEADSTVSSQFTAFELGCLQYQYVWKLKGKQLKSHGHKEASLCFIDDNGDIVHAISKIIISESDIFVYFKGDSREGISCSPRLLIGIGHLDFRSEFEVENVFLHASLFEASEHPEYSKKIILATSQIISDHQPRNIRKMAIILD